MCIDLCQCFTEFIPYVFLVLLPLLGSFSGTDVVLRCSLLLCVHSVVVEITPKLWRPLKPLLHLLVFWVLASLPLIWVPQVLVWCYKHLVWLAEPLFLVAEGILAQNLVMRCGQLAREKITKKNNPEIWRALIAIFSALCYVCSAAWFWELYLAGTSLQIGCLFFVLLMIVSVHNMLWMARLDVVSDAAFCTVCLVASLGAMFMETKIISSPFQIPWQWRLEPSSSILEILSSILTTSTDEGNHALKFLKGIITPFFMLTLVLRLYSIIFIFAKLTNNFSEKLEIQEITETNKEKIMDAITSWHTPLTMKVSIIFILTQLITTYLSMSSGQFLAFVSGASPVKMSYWPREILLGRMLQIVSIAVFYMWRLCRSEDWKWIKWLTP
ncbi:uncharacterized protein LOC112562625 [Pomacea canaliculata]|uniref:uncharacterized protein LOC112562625 n=1 Tax=Pomacea canaliculata TaxID=400727 RepID=UPI000D735472|nr:uncharacterized protein LOC112562625 [Pomacea canaliculata]